MVNAGIMRSSGDTLVNGNKNSFDYVKVLGIIGVAAVLLTMISDIILLGRPDSAFSFFTYPTECMADISQWRITAGVFIGVFMLPFQLAGLVPLYYGLKPLGRKKQLLVVIPAGHALTMGIAFHMSYSFMASGWKLSHKADELNDLINEGLVPNMMKNFDFYWKFLIVIMMAELIISSFIFIILVLNGKTLFPKLMAAFNPFFILGVLFAIIYFIPAPVGGFVAPTILNTSNLTFFIISTAVVHKRTR